MAKEPAGGSTYHFYRDAGKKAQQEKQGEGVVLSLGGEYEQASHEQQIKRRGFDETV
jgi:hypothetical protein